MHCVPMEPLTEFPDTLLELGIRGLLMKQSLLLHLITPYVALASEAQ